MAMMKKLPDLDCDTQMQAEALPSPWSEPKIEVPDIALVVNKTDGIKVSALHLPQEDRNSSVFELCV